MKLLIYVKFIIKDIRVIVCDYDAALKIRVIGKEYWTSYVKPIKVSLYVDIRFARQTIHSKLAVDTSTDAILCRDKNFDSKLIEPS